MTRKTPLVAVIGSGSCPPGSPLYDAALQVGNLLAARGYAVVTGGLGGVMEAASKGATAARADHREAPPVLAILPGSDPREANPWVDVAIPTGLGQARNAVIANAADAFVAIDKGLGTLSEIAFALRQEKPVVGLHTWDLPELLPQAATAEQAVQYIEAKLNHVD